MGCQSSMLCPSSRAQEVVFEYAAKEMLRLSATAALAHPDCIEVKAPTDQVGEDADETEMQRLVSELRAAAKVSHAEAGGPTAGALRRSATVASLLGRAQELASSLSWQARAASSLEAAEAACSKQLTEMGRAILTNNRSAITKMFTVAIGSLRIPAAVSLVRGASANGPGASSGPDDALTAFFMQSPAAPAVQAQLADLVAAAPELPSVLRLWHSFVNKVIEASTTVCSASEQDKHLRIIPPGLAMPDYVAGQLLEELARSMCSEEAALRAKPQGKSRNPKTFEMCFSGTPDRGPVFQRLQSC